MTTKEYKVIADYSNRAGQAMSAGPFRSRSSIYSASDSDQDLMDAYRRGNDSGDPRILLKRRFYEGAKPRKLRKLDLAEPVGFTPKI